MRTKLGHAAHLMLTFHIGYFFCLKNNCSESPKYMACWLQQLHIILINSYCNIESFVNFFQVYTSTQTFVRSHHYFTCFLHPPRTRERNRKKRREMKAFIGFIIVFIFGLSATVNSQTDSCSSTLNLQNVNLPFDAASLNCLAVWDAHNYILRVSQPHLFHHSFIHT